MRYKGLDLNLLVAFDALMQTRSVTLAGERLNLSQSAMSAALSRLRAFFNDDLFIAHGKRMHPTAFAESLVPFVQEGLNSFEALLSAPATFDPATSSRQFRIIASDYFLASVLHPLIRHFAINAPNIRLEVQLPAEASTRLLDEGMADLVISPEYVLSTQHPSEVLYEEDFLLAGWSRNPLFSGPITEEAIFSAGHVAVAIGTSRTSSFADRQLEVLGKKRRIELVLPQFSTLPLMLEGTMRLAILQRRLVHTLDRRFDIVTAPLPFAIPPLRQRMFFHEARRNDAGLVWLRNQIHDLADQTNP